MTIIDKPRLLDNSFNTSSADDQTSSLTAFWAIAKSTLKVTVSSCDGRITHAVAWLSGDGVKWDNFLIEPVREWNERIAATSGSTAFRREVMAEIADKMADRAFHILSRTPMDVDADA